MSCNGDRQSWVRYNVGGVVYQSQTHICNDGSESDVSALSRSASAVGPGGQNPRHYHTELGMFYWDRCYAYWS